MELTAVQKVRDWCSRPGKEWALGLSEIGQQM